MQSFLCIALLAALASAQHHKTKWSPGQKVKTFSGIVEGHESNWQEGVSEYLGIPFAHAPVGELRFAPPKAYISSAEFNASSFGPDCPAVLRPFTEKDRSSPAAGLLEIVGQVGDTMSEDCLSLNVWTKPQSGNPGKAVMVWFYGGAFSIGTSASPIFDGARLANENDVVVVTLNYRVNMFGFPGAPFLQDNNLGLLDQRMAVEWVRDNIAYFGGNPNRITLFGESAGSASVDYYDFAWGSNPIVKGLIAQSGAASIGNGGASATGQNWFSVANKLGCDANDESTLPCLRNKTMTELLDAMKPSASGPAPAFAPYVDQKLVFGDYPVRRGRGIFSKIPMLVGNNDNEAALFAILSGAGTNVSTTPSAGNSSSGAGPAPLSTKEAADAFFTCPSGISATARRDQDVSAWRYRYAGDFPNRSIGPGSGAYHGAEIALVFGTSEKMGRGNDTAEEARLGRVMREAWTTFAKDPVNGLTKLGWPLYNETGNTLIVLGGADSSNITFEASGKYDTGCDALDPFLPYYASGKSQGRNAGRP